MGKTKKEKGAANSPASGGASVASTRSNASSAVPDDAVSTRCTEKDVIFGRGKRVSVWPGNVHFRQVVNRYREEYSTAERSAKVQIATMVMEAIHSVGGRFLKEIPAGHFGPGSKSGWYVVERDRAVEKTCQVSV